MPGRRRGLGGQRERLAAKQAHRDEALAFVAWARGRGLSREAAIRWLWLSPSTLAVWETREGEDGSALRALGRPPTRGSAGARDQVVACLRNEPRLSLTQLQARFSGLPRREVAELRERYLSHYRDQVFALEWLRPGRVWAIDYSNPPQPIDGVYTKLLMIRDLASGYQLLALPCEGESAATTRAALEQLIAEVGAPLVLKLDNGSPLRAELVVQALDAAGVEVLPSPPYTPEYNGSVEAGNGSIKTRARHEAARHGRAHWICDDLEAALAQANHAPRRGGPAAELWASRTPIPVNERCGFRETIAAERSAKLPLRDPDDGDITQDEIDQITREVIGQALVELGYLRIERRSIPLAKRRRRSTKNS